MNYTAKVHQSFFPHIQLHTLKVQFRTKNNLSVRKESFQVNRKT